MNASFMMAMTIAIVIAIPLATFIGYLVYEHGKDRRNRPYKSLAEHALLNAGNREDWAAGISQSGKVEELNSVGTLVAPIIQLVTVIVLAVMVLISDTSTEKEIALQREQISTLETQIHALAFAGGSEPAPAKADPDPAASLLPAGSAPAGTSPMQQACANLIGRVADAYEKGESSKIALSLEQLVKKLNCVNGMPP